MFRFPTPPNTLVTRQIECVSCKETFTVAEDIANENVSPSWHIPASQPAHTAIHQRPHLERHLIRPLSRATPEQKAEVHHTWDDNVHEPVNCPRCGTDNRNWMRIAYADPPGSFWERQRIRLHDFHLIWLGYIVMVLAAGWLVFRQWERETWQAHVFIFIMIFLAGIIPIRSITGHWREIRDNKIKNKYDTTRSIFQRVSPGLIEGFAYFSIFVVVIPLLVYVFLPELLGYFKTEDNSLAAEIDKTVLAVDEENLAALQEVDPKSITRLDNALVGLQRTLNDRMFLCHEEDIPGMITNLENLKLQNPTPETIVMADNAIYSLHQLQIQENAGGCTATLVANALFTSETLTQPGAARSPGEQINATLLATRLLLQENLTPELEAAVKSHLNAIREVVEKANGVKREPGTFTLLYTWMKYVGLTCLVAVITAVFATDSYIKHINRHLPQPLCQSIRNLTRVVLWEARHSLEINGNFHRIEWTEAYQNKIGGISLSGHLCPPPNDAADEKKYVRGMNFFIFSDMWGRVQSAVAKPARIPPSVYQAWDSHLGNTDETINQLFNLQNKD